MKIVLPVHHFLPRYSAGAELYTLRLGRWLQEHGHQVAVVCVEAIDQGAPGELAAVAEPYGGLMTWRLSFNLAQADPRWRYANPLLLEWFRSYFMRENPDIVHCQAGYLLGAAPLLAAADAHIPTALTLHDYWFICPRITLQRGDGSLCAAVPDDPAGCVWCERLASRRYRLPDQWTGGLLGRAAQTLALDEGRRLYADRRAQLRAALDLPAALIAPSHFLAAQFAPLLGPDRVRVVRLGLDREPFLQLRPHTPAPTMRLGFIGQVAPHKGVHLLVEAFRQLQPRDRPLELYLHGGLEANPRYVARLRELAAGDARIHFCGRFENQRAAEILAELDALVVPSLWYENSPLSIMEAHAAGTPVITAALGGMAELVRDGVDGLHFAPASAADLARQLQRLIDEPGLLPQLRAGIVMPRGVDDEMSDLLQIYQQLAERAGVPHEVN